MEQGGKIANRTGKSLEEFITHSLNESGYSFVDRKNWKTARYLDQPIYTRQLYLCKSIYGTNVYGDFVIFHPEKYPRCLVIESKWQQVSGSVDEKLPFLVQNIKEKFPTDAIVIIDGGGSKKGAIEWVKSQIGGKLINVFGMMDFQKWKNNGNL
nr:PD-(D/E)XK nuclease superfamily protein [uncultured Methanoregula sp.]